MVMAFTEESFFFMVRTRPTLEAALGREMVKAAEEASQVMVSSEDVAV
jgi:hypothetical protein